MYCDNCISTTHHQSPFHRITKWDGQCFVRAALWQTGLVLQLGHGGMACPLQPSYEASLGGSSLGNTPGSTPMDNGEGMAELDADEACDSEKDEDWIDEDERTLQEDDLKPPQESKGLRGDSWMLVVHTNGIHYLRIRYCKCPGHADHHEQLLASRLYAASIRRPGTVFTFHVLDDFYLENLECKTPARNYFSKLRRLTSNLVPHLVAVSVQGHATTLQPLTLTFTDPGPIPGVHASLKAME